MYITPADDNAVDDGDVIVAVDDDGSFVSYQAL
jgi:hypothetical protein